MTFMRIASLILPTSKVLFATVALAAEPPAAPANETTSPNANTTTAAPSGWTTAPAPSAPAATPTPAAAPSTNPNPPANTAPQTPTSPASSLAPSPYDSAAATATPPKETQPAATEVDNGPPTLLGKAGDYAFGGFGGIGVMYTRFAGENAVQVCGEGAVIIDHTLTLGGGGCGITTLVNAEQYGPAPHDPRDRLTFGYGGAIIRYHLFSNSPINLGVGALIGAGGLSIGTWNGDTNGADSFTHVRSEAVFVFEPQVGGYANVTRWLRIGINGGYRIVSSVNMQGLSSGDISAPTLGGVIQAGWF